MPLKPPPNESLIVNNQLSVRWRKWFQDITGTAELVDSPTVDNFASLDSDGNIQDSGYDATSFSASGHSHTVSDVTDFTEQAVVLLGSASINGQTTTKQTIYTVATGKTMVPHMIYVRSPSASLAGLTDMDVGGNANADDWIQQITLNAFTATTDYGVVMQPEQAAGPPIVPEKKTLYAAATVFGVMINTGSTNPATFTIDLFGYLF